MSNRIFQNMLVQYNDIIDKEIGIIDDNGCIIACTDTEKIGLEHNDIYKEINYIAELGRYIKNGYTYKLIEYNSIADYILFIAGEDGEAFKMLSLLAVSLGGIKDLYEDHFNKSTFIKNVILDNILPGDIYLKSKEFNFNENVERVTYLIRFAALNEYNPIDIIESMFPDRSKDFVVSVNEKDVVLIREIKPDNIFHKIEDIENVAKDIVATVNTEFFMKAVVGIGGPVFEIKELSRSFKEAQIALEVGKVFDTEKDVVNYKNLGIGRIIYQLPTTLCEVFLEEVFKAGSLESLDRESLMTINSFFENSLNVSETSRKLFVHRNTLVYRLEKIKRLTGLDLREFDHAIVFKVALMVKKYLACKPIKY
ncbi:MAG: helix-turn-helix domain-containing protein [Oscillospiraceae bacterium]|nr:helix-turn-helix domain-containing protein [Oscillospiraceae bacterium]